MTEYTTYVAFDGTEFDDEDDCLAYERTMKATDYEKEISFYGFDRKPIPLHVKYLDEVCFVNIKTEKACQWFVDRCDEDCSRHPWSYDPHRKENFPLTGFFWFDINNDCWRCWQTEMEKLNEIQVYFQLFEEEKEEKHCWDERYVPSQFELNP